MASITKHLSTHLYFHMERSNRKQSNSPTTSSGFHQSDHHTSSGGSQRPRSWNKENDRTIEPRHEPPRSASPEPHRGSIMGRDWPEDYFSYSPYLLTPDLSAKGRSRRRTGKRAGARYELCLEDDEDWGPPGPTSERPRLRPPEPTSPLLVDRRLLPPTPEGGRAKVRGVPREDQSSSTFQDEIEEDCFIVPAHMRGRFLPVRNGKGVLSSQEMNTFEVSDPKVCIVIDFRENGAFSSPDLAFPRLTPPEWLAGQLRRHSKAFQWVRDSQTAIEGLLLMNVERHSQFPFVTYLVTNTIHSDPRRLIVQLRSSTSQTSEPLQHTDFHFITEISFSNGFKI